MKKITLFTISFAALFASGCSATSPTPLTTNPTVLPSSSAVGASVAAPSNSSSPASSSQAQYTLADVSKHSTASDCWLVVSGNVYNVTDFIPTHPGGQEILRGCGKDATTLFQSQREHQGAQAQSILPTLKIGTLK